MPFYVVEATLDNQTTTKVGQYPTRRKSSQSKSILQLCVLPFADSLLKISIMAMDKLVFHWADYLVFVAMLVASASIGVFYAVMSRKHNSSGEFMLASRKVSMFMHYPVDLGV